jgi:hypothetical protein
MIKELDDMNDFDIKNYKNEEIIALFRIDKDESNLLASDVKKAKNEVIKMHPDKSKMDSKFFIFYKKAFEVLVNIYDNVNKINQKVIDVKEYNNENMIVDFRNGINESLNEKDFNEKFNKIFDEKYAVKPININEWFSEEEDTYVDKNNNQTINEKIEDIKQQQKKNQINLYRPVASVYSNAGNHLSIYGSDSYSNYSGTLQYDDLRKVHKDETVLIVDNYENNIISIEDIKKIRNQQDSSCIHETTWIELR